MRDIKYLGKVLQKKEQILFIQTMVLYFFPSSASSFLPFVKDNAFERFDVVLLSSFSKTKQLLETVVWFDCKACGLIG